MTNPFRTPEDYELFLYSLRERYAGIHASSLAFIRRGASLARMTGEACFDEGLRLVVRERLVFDRLPMTLDSYGYEVWRGEKKLYWYDSQPHPDDSALQATHPHHKHVRPDIKRHRIPAPALSFTQPNLPALIEEIEALVESLKAQAR
ncbi:MAG: DUF6516 family protein [Candidatus Sumerlaeota bacterium]|nr:DUF6516 family protein [Candidatus Sumerlaeota bacterium]